MEQRPMLMMIWPKNDHRAVLAFRFLLLSLFLLGGMKAFAEQLPRPSHNSFFCQTFLSYPNIKQVAEGRTTKLIVDQKTHAIYEAPIGFFGPPKPIFWYDPHRLQGVPQNMLSATLPGLVTDLLVALQDDANILTVDTPRETFRLVINGPGKLQDNVAVLSADGRTLINFWGKPAAELSYDDLLYQVVRYKGHKSLAKIYPPFRPKTGYFSAKQVVSQKVVPTSPANGFPYEVGDDFVLLAISGRTSPYPRIVNPVSGLPMARIIDQHIGYLLPKALENHLAAQFPANVWGEYFRYKRKVYQILTSNLQDFTFAEVLRREAGIKNDPLIDLQQIATITGFVPIGQDAILDEIGEYIIKNILPNVHKFYELIPQNHGRPIEINAAPSAAAAAASSPAAPPPQERLDPEEEEEATTFVGRRPEDEMDDEGDFFLTPEEDE